MSNTSQRGGANPATRGLLLIGALALIGWLLLVRMGGSGGGSSVDVAQAIEDATENLVSEAPASSSVEVLSPVTASTAEARNPSAVKVVVLNGTTKSGLAKGVVPSLTTAGYTQTSATNADKDDYAASVVYYAPGYDPEARTIATTLGIATVQPVPVPAPRSGEVANVFVVLGADKATGVAAAASDSTVAGAAAVTTEATTPTTASTSAAG